MTCYLQKMVDIYSETIKFTNPYHISYIAQKVIEQKANALHLFSGEELNGTRIREISSLQFPGSPVELVREMSAMYEMDDLQGLPFMKSGRRQLYRHYRSDVGFKK